MECGYSPKQIANLFFGSPVPALPGKVVVGNLSLGKNTAAGRSCSLPYHRHYSPPPTKLPLNALYRHAVEQVCDRRHKWHRTGWLLASAGYVSPCCKLCLWYMRFCAEVFFFCSHTVLPMEHSLGVNFFFSSLSSCKCCTFLPFPVFLFCLPRCHMYVVYVWTGLWLTSLVLVTSDNKGLLLLLLILLLLMSSISE